MSSLERSILLLLVALCLGVSAYTFRWEMLDVEHLVHVGAFLLERPSMLLSIVLPLLAVIAIPLLTRASTIHIDSTGIQVRWTLPMLRPVVARNVPWEQVTSVSYVPRTGLLAIRSSKGLAWAVRASEWIDSAAAGSEENIDVEPVLVGLVRRRGLFNRKSAAIDVTEFDLMSDRRTRLLIFLGAALGLYAMFDGMCQSESWAFFNAQYLMPHLVIGTAVAAITVAALWRSTATRALPRVIVFGMGMFIAMTAVLASYAVGVRVNQLLGGPLGAHVYHRDRECMNLVPVEADLPVIEYTKVTKTYWCRISGDEPVHVLVRRGLFGLYQVNLESHTEDIRRFLGGA